VSEWFFTRIETLQGVNKMRFFALRKMLGSKNHFLLELKFIFQKKDKIKHSEKFIEAV
jgi:hypothetical protein